MLRILDDRHRCHSCAHHAGNSPAKSECRAEVLTQLHAYQVGVRYIAKLPPRDARKLRGTTQNGGSGNAGSEARLSRARATGSRGCLGFARKVKTKWCTGAVMGSAASAHPESPPTMRRTNVTKRDAVRSGA